MIQAVLCLFHLTSPPQLGFEIASSLGFGNHLVTSLCLSPLIKKERKIWFNFRKQRLSIFSYHRFSECKYQTNIALHCTVFE